MQLRHRSSGMFGVAAVLKSAPDRQVRVPGPVDPAGKRAAVQRELTLACSLALLEFLRANGVTAESAVTTTHEQGQPIAADRFFALSLVPVAEELPKLPSTEQLHEH